MINVSQDISRMYGNTAVKNLVSV